MTAATLAPLDTEDGSFFVTDAMYVEIQQATKGNSSAVAAVIYPAKTRDGWDFEVTASMRSAERLASEIGPDAVTLYL